jgi:pyruvate carboxylase
MISPKYLFAYGTLMRGRAPREIARAVSTLRPVGRGSVAGSLYDFGEYPGLVANVAPREQVFGVVYELPDDAKVLSRIDSYEGFNASKPAESLFIRRKRLVRLSSGKRLLCWVYEYNHEPQNGRRIEHGRYSRARKRNSRPKTTGSAINPR